MGRIDDVERAEMTTLLLRQKQASRDLAEAQEAVEKWRQRLSMAERHNERTLAEQAADRLAAAEEAMAAARHELDVISQEKSVLRHSANLPEGHDTAGAEALLEDFRALGVHPEEAELREVSRAQSAEDMLTELKKKLGRK